MTNEKQMMKQLNNRKQFLVQQLKALNTEKENNHLSEEEYEYKKNQIERELVEIMDRLTQLNFIFKQ